MYIQDAQVSDSTVQTSMLILIEALAHETSTRQAILEHELNEAHEPHVSHNERHSHLPLSLRILRSMARHRAVPPLQEAGLFCSLIGQFLGLF
jgi:hypothetical protein